MKNAKLSGADIWYVDPGEVEKKLFEPFCEPILNYDRNDDKHDYKNNNRNNDIDHNKISQDYINNYNNDNRTSEIETKRQRKIFEVLVFYFQR